MRDANTLVPLRTERKHGAVPLEPATRRALDDYAEARNGQAAAASSNIVFISSYGESLARQTINKFVAGYARACGMQRSMSPQTLRDTFAIHGLEGGVGLENLRESLGHVNASTTKVYSNAMDPERYAEHLPNHPRSVVGDPRH